MYISTISPPLTFPWSVDIMIVGDCGRSSDMYVLYSLEW
jgi:hypothetical protein